MKSETISIDKIFKDRRQLLAPYFQRGYVWDHLRREALWEDVVEKAEARLAKAKPTPHFLGALVLDPQEKEGLIGVDVLHIIDGQQRLTTLQMMIAALAQTLRKRGMTAVLNVVEGCLWNGNPDTMRDPAVEIYKLWPTYRDRANYQLAMSALATEDLRTRFPAHFTQAGELRRIGITHPAPLDAIWFFAWGIDQWIGTDPTTASVRAEQLVLAVFNDLKIVCITLDSDDDAQVIFETLNGRGAALHATDLIRNYLFMQADRRGENSQHLYNTVWSQFESPYWSEDQKRGRLNKPRLEWFIHAALQAELHDEIDLGRLYNAYQKFAKADGGRSAAKQLEVLDAYGKYYEALVSGSGDTPIGVFGRRIAPYEVTTVYALALSIAGSGLSTADQSQMFGDLASYVVRRSVCGLSTKAYNQVFLAALRQLDKQGMSPTALREHLSKLDGESTRWPTDDEFRNACQNAKLYGADGYMGTASIRAVLTELEGQLRRDARTEEPVPPNLQQLDVEHICPQAWWTYWPLLGGVEVQAEEVETIRLMVRAGGSLDKRQAIIADRIAAVQRLGNLTLLNLSVNRQAQNFSFEKKKELLLANSSLRLNVPQMSRTHWDEEAIAARGATLADAAVALWPSPSA